MATILAICLGILLPWAAMPVHVCLLAAEERSEDCCKSCTTTHEDCCADLELLPDSPVPGSPFETPAFVGYFIPSATAVAQPMPWRIAPPSGFARIPTGIGPPVARLAVLNVWRL